jgi:hypothetical protein
MSDEIPDSEQYRVDYLARIVIEYYRINPAKMKYMPTTTFLVMGNHDIINRH